MLTKFKGFAASLSLALLTAFALLPGMAFAQIELPTADVLADIVLIVAFITAVGAAVLGLIYVAKGFNWAKKAG